MQMTIAHAGSCVRVSSPVGVYTACAFLRLQMLARDAWRFLLLPAA